MQSAFWKLTVLAGVVGTGFLVVLQAQQGLNRSAQESNLDVELDGEFANEAQPGESAEQPQLHLAEAPQSEQTEPAGDFDPFGSAPTQLTPEPEPEGTFGAQSETEVASAPAFPTDNQAPPLDDSSEPPQLADDSEPPQLVPANAASGANAPSFGADPNPFGKVAQRQAPAKDDPSAQLEQGSPFGADEPTDTAGADSKAEEIQPVAQSTPELAAPSEKHSFGAFDEDKPAEEPTTEVAETDSAPVAEGGPRMLAPNPTAEAYTRSAGPSFSADPEPEQADDAVEPASATAQPEPAFDDSKPAKKEPKMVPVRQVPKRAAPRTAELSFGEDSNTPAEDSNPPSVSDASPFNTAEAEPLPQAESTETPPTLGVPEPEMDAEPPGEERTEPEPEPEQLPAMGRDTPKRLSPPSDVAPLTSSNPDIEQLKGDGTIDREVPRGRLQPNLQIEKIAPQNAVLGQPLVYSIIVRNTGNAAAQGVVVEDRIPKGTELNGTIPRAEMIGKKLTWKLGTLKPGDTQTIRIRVVPKEEGQVGSVATVNFVAEVAAETIVTAPRLDVKVTAPDQVRLGEAVPIKFHITNNGSGTATGIVIRDLVPNEMTHQGGNDLEYEIGKLAPGDSTDVQLVLTAVQSGNVLNRAIISAEGSEPQEFKTELQVVGTNVEVTRAGPKSRYLGREANYTNTVTNLTESATESLQVIETIPEGMEFVQAAEGGVYDEGQRTVTWQIDSLGPRDRLDLAVTLRSASVGSHESKVAVVDSANTRKEITSVTSVAGFTSLDVDVSSVDGPLAVGEEVSVSIGMKNSGTDAATNVGLVVHIPPQLAVASVNSNVRYTQNGNRLMFERVRSLSGGGEETAEIVLTARAKGAARIRVEIGADHLSQPLVHDESLVVLSDAE